MHYLKTKEGRRTFDTGLAGTLDFIRDYYDGDPMAFAKAYYEAVASIDEYGKFDIIGHFDLITKNNALGALDRILGNKCGLGKEFERSFELFGAMAQTMIGLIIIAPAIGVLMEALVVVGIAMSFAGSSRPASGSEHHLSHFFEITGIVRGEEYFPHGIDVEYHASGCVTFPCLGTKARQEDKLAFDPDRSKRRAIYKDVCEVFSDYTVFVGGSSSFDMAPAPYNKAYALDLFCKENGLQHENVVYIGDDYGPGGNDESVYLSDFPYLTIDDYRTFPQVVAPLLEK